MKIAIISDIHSAADHFRDAVDASREEGFDKLVVLGDLFTYGPDPVSTLEIASDAAARDGAVLIKGNHDLLYSAGADEDSYASKLPDWIRESIEWTRESLGRDAPAALLPWKEEWIDENLLFSHANPFGFGDWTYLRDEASMTEAYHVLRERSLDWGIFGHVHRFQSFSPDGGRSGVATVGSIGQPRDKAEPFSQWAMVTTAPFTIERRRVSKDWNSTIEKIRASSLSEPTKRRLCEFYR